MGVGPGDLQTLAEDYLQACAEALDEIPGSPGLGLGFVGAPDRAFVTYGTPAADCDQLTVHAVPLTVGGNAPINAAVVRVNHVTLVATLFRCGAAWTSSTEFPSPAAQQAFAEQVNADRWALWNYPYTKWCKKQLFEDCGDVGDWILQQLQPSGGMAGTTLTVTVSLQGYEPTIVI